MDEIKKRLQDADGQIAALQAAMVAQGVVLDALIESHPEPEALFRRWGNLLAAQVAHNQLQLQARGAVYDQELKRYLQRWDEAVRNRCKDVD